MMSSQRGSCVRRSVAQPFYDASARRVSSESSSRIEPKIFLPAYQQAYCFRLAHYSEVLEQQTRSNRKVPSQGRLFQPSLHWQEARKFTTHRFRASYPLSCCSRQGCVTWSIAAYRTILLTSAGLLGGLGRYESRQNQASEDRLVFPAGHGVILLASGLQRRCLPRAEQPR